MVGRQNQIGVVLVDYKVGWMYPVDFPGHDPQRPWADTVTPGILISMGRIRHHTPPTPRFGIDHVLLEDGPQVFVVQFR
jgi:hypothetical protein